MRTNFPRAGRALAAFALIALPLAACGGDDSEDEPTGTDSTEQDGGEGIAVEAEDSLKFDPEDITAPAGEITFDLVNGGSIAHTFVIEEHEDALKLTVAGSGDDDSGSIELEAGTYTFYCDVSGHRGGGMEGTLTVE